jgi:DNA uptake protein ComE-like DNA-binding protein
VTMKKLISNVVCVISLIAFAGIPAFAAETMSPAKRKMLEKTKKEGAAGAPATGSGEARTGLVDLNTGTRKQLMNIPGVGEAEADKIIAGRPYKETAQLRKKEIIPMALFYQIVNKVTVNLEKKEITKPAPPPKPEKSQEKQGEPKRDLFKEFK